MKIYNVIRISLIKHYIFLISQLLLPLITATKNLDIILDFISGTLAVSLDNVIDLRLVKLFTISPLLLIMDS